MNAKVYDIIVFGATGYTGKIVCEKLALYCSKITSISWAVAGRNENKLKDMLKNTANVLDLPSLNDIACISTSIESPESLLKMAQQTRIVINCVGPYSFYGEPVVRACISGSAHHLDISGEPIFLESMQLNFHKEAEQMGVYIIGSCGFDSLPAELGIKFICDTFDGDLNEVEGFIKETGTGSLVHYGTWESAINGFASRNQLYGLRKEMYPTPLPLPRHLQKSRGLIFYEPTVSSWCVPFIGCDRSVVYRSQRCLFETNQIKNVVQFMPYLCVSNVLVAYIINLFGFIFGLLTSFKLTSRLLLKCPRLFSFGIVSKVGSTRDQLKKSSFTTTFIGKGFSRAASKSSEIDKVMDKTLVTSCSGPNPGYVTCAICVTQAAVTLLEDVDKMPGKGGVYAPGAAFWNTNLWKRLEEEGVISQNLTVDVKKEN